MRSAARELFETALLAALFFLLLQVVVQPFRVEQISMEPTLHEGQLLIVSKVAYLDLDRLLTRRAAAAEPGTPGPSSLPIHGAPQRGDIVVLEHPTSPGQHLVKRVIGLPGETIEIRDRHVYVDGQPLKESYIAAAPTYRTEPLTIPADEVYVMGDNRNNSYDSHVFGPVPRDSIVGRATVLPAVALGGIGSPRQAP